MYDLKQLLMRSIEEQASDVHFTVGRPPCYRVDGVLSPIEGERLTPDMLRELLVPIMEERHKEELSRDGQTDFAYAIPGVGRFRVNVFMQRGTFASVMRCLPFEIPEPESLGIPKEVVEITSRKRGLVLVTGPTGSGGPVALSNDGFVIENNAYALTLHNVEKYLKVANGEYKQKCKLYAKVTSTVSLYGQLKTNTSWSSIDLKQRQLFEMD